MVGIKLATVTALFDDGTAKIQFFSEDVSSEKEYPYLASYVPVIGDKVFLMPFAGSYVIIGKMLYMEAPEGGSVAYITADDLATELKKYAKTDHTHSEYAASSHSHSGYAASEHSHYRLISSAGNLYVGFRYANAGPFIPSASNSIDLGGTGYLWKNIYASSGTIQTSDRKAKKNIFTLSEDGRYEKLFALLKPSKFKMKKGESGRDHTGFVAQDVFNAMKKAKLSTAEFAGYIEMPVYKTDEEGKETTEVERVDYGLRYEEFIALNTMMIQKAFDRITELETKIKEMEG